MRQYITIEYALIFSLFSFIIWGLITIYRIHTNPKFSQFDCLDLITTRDKKIDRPAFQEFLVFIVMIWGFIIQMIKSGSAPEWYVGILVGAFVIRAAHSSYLKSKETVVTEATIVKDIPQGTTETKSIKTEAVNG